MLPAEPPRDGRPPIHRWRSEHHGVDVTEQYVDGRIEVRWDVIRDGKSVLSNTFTTVDAMTKDIRGFVEGLRRERALELAPTPEAAPRLPERKEFVTLLVGVWDDAYPPFVNQFVQVPPGETDPLKCRMVPSLGAVPRKPDAGPELYPVAKRVLGRPDLAIIADWRPSLAEAFDKAVALELGVINTESNPEPAKAQVAKGRGDLAVHPNSFKEELKRGDKLIASLDPDPKDENAEKLNRIIQRGPSPERRQEPPPGVPPQPKRQVFLSVVRYQEPYHSSEAAWVEVVRSFPGRKEALRFAEGRQDYAVHSTVFKEELKPGTKLVAWKEPNPKDENERQLNEIIDYGRRPEQRQEPPLDVPPKPKGPANAPQPEEPTASKLNPEGAGAFRPVLVEMPPWPPKEVYVWAVVKALDTVGEEEVLFEVVKIYDKPGKAELATAFKKDLAVFPRSLEKGQIKEGQWFKAKINGRETDRNARKIREIAERVRDSYLPRQTPQQRQEKGQGLSPGL